MMPTKNEEPRTKNFLPLPLYGINTLVKRSWVILLCMVPATLCTADFTRYQVILDRMPFGVEAVPPPPGTPLGTNGRPLPPPDSFTKTLKMCAVTRHALTGRLEVGFVDTASKKNYFIAVGDTEDGITVVEADYDAETALLRKGDQEGKLTMSDVASMTAAAGQPTGGPGMAGFGPGGMGRPAFPPGLTMGRPPGMPGFSAPGAGALTGVAGTSGSTPGAMSGPPSMGMRSSMPARSSDGASLSLGAQAGVASNLSSIIHAERLDPKLTGDALQQHIQQYQMDLIRAGGTKGPPLPMQLTPEMDQQLVKEGVLPPLPPQ